MKNFKADLHVHTILSPCAEIEMIPPLIVQEAINKSIDIIAITDHNAIANIEAVQNAAKNTDLHIIPGLELQTKEEIHSLCLFPTLKECESFYLELLPYIPPLRNDPDLFGEQFIVDETGAYIRRENQLLISSISLSLEDSFKLVKMHNGLFIPAHIDNRTFGLIGHLGFIPETIQFDALELSKNLDFFSFRDKNIKANYYPLIHNSDAHQLSDICGYTDFFIEEPTLLEIQSAFKCINKRRFKVQLE